MYHIVTNTGLELVHIILPGKESTYKPPNLRCRLR